MLRFKNFYLLLIVFFFSCKKEEKKTINKNVSLKEVNIFEHSIPNTKNYDFSSIKKDTFLIKGKQIVLIKPSEKEINILKNIDGIRQTVSSYNQYTTAVKDSLKKYYHIATTSKRIIAIQLKGNKTIYIDRLMSKNRKPIHFGMFLVFNKYHKIITNPYKDYYGIIQEYYNKIRFENQIDTKYVIAKNGLNIRDRYGSVIGKYNNGDHVNIIGYLNDIKEIKDEGKIIKGRTAIVRWKGKNDIETRGYVFEGYLGEITDVKVYQDQLCYGRSYKVLENGKINFENKAFTCLNKALDFELISKTTFDNLPVIHNNFLTINKRVKVSKDSIILPIKKGKVVFKNKDVFTDSRAIYEYHGDFDFLNSYLLNGLYWEGSGYFLINRDSGKRTIFFEGFPQIFPNKKRIIEFSYNYYEGISTLKIYSIKKQTITLIAYYNFEFWAGIPAEFAVKWINEDTFVVEIQHKKTIGKSSKVKNTQYLKLRIK